MLTTKELAEELRKSPAWVSQAAKHGEIPAHRIGNEWRFDLSEVLAATSNQRPVVPSRPRKRRAA